MLLKEIGRIPSHSLQSVKRLCVGAATNTKLQKQPMAGHFLPDNSLKYCKSRHLESVCAAAAAQHSALTPAHYSCYFQCSLHIALARNSREISLQTGSSTSGSQLQIISFLHPVSHALPKPSCVHRYNEITIHVHLQLWQTTETQIGLGWKRS